MTPSDLSDLAPGGSNLREMTVSELSYALKRVVEDNFDYVRVRGEISGFKRATSGHLYMALKDDQSVLDAVCWRGVAEKLTIRPEDGLEVVVTGKLTTYPGRSKYQLVIQSMEAAGVGALMALLEARRQKLMAEGLFEASTKKPLPYLPRVIGVVTSPTGAVIRDILHRLADRFPRHVLVWPVLVQGEGAAAQIAAAIRGFNSIAPGGPVPRPDVLIVARGGGSLEDLMAFNEEMVVRAAAASHIPLISAVGHETDTTLIDFASDRRAPTPTAAAEIAVPVQADLQASVSDLNRRLDQARRRLFGELRDRLKGLVRALPQPSDLLALPSQRLDGLGDRLPRALRLSLDTRSRRLDQMAGRLAMQSPGHQIERKALVLSNLAERLHRSMHSGLANRGTRLSSLTRLLNPVVLVRDFDRQATLSQGLATELHAAAARQMDRKTQDLASLSRVLESFSYTRTLERGYSVVRDEHGALIRLATRARRAAQLDVEFQDGHVAMTVARPTAPKSLKPGGTDPADDGQGSLL